MGRGEGDDKGTRCPLGRSPRQGQAKARKDTRASGPEKPLLCRGGCRECGHEATPDPAVAPSPPAGLLTPLGPLARGSPFSAVSCPVTEESGDSDCKHSPGRDHFRLGLSCAG